MENLLDLTNQVETQPIEVALETVETGAATKPLAEVESETPAALRGHRGDRHSAQGSSCEGAPRKGCDKARSLQTRRAAP